MIVSTKKKPFDAGQVCRLESGEYLFVVRKFGKPFKTKEGRGWLVVETTAIGQREKTMEPEPGPSLMFEYTQEEGFVPSLMGEGAWQAFNTALQMPEADSISTDEYIDAPFNGMVSLAEREGMPILDKMGNQRRNLRDLAPATQAQMKAVVLPYLQLKGKM